MEKASSKISTEHSSLLRRSCLNSPSLKLVISGTFSFSVSFKPHETHTDAHAHTRTRTLKKEKQGVTSLNGSCGSQATGKQCHIHHVGSRLPGKGPGHPWRGSTHSRDREKGHSFHKTEASLTLQSRHVNYWLGSEPLQIIKRYLLFFFLIN